MVKVKKNITLDEARSMVAGHDTSIGMPWEKISQRMEVLYKKVVEQAGLIGELKCQNGILTERLNFWKSLEYHTACTLGGCDYRKLSAIVKLNEVYNKACNDKK